MDADTGTATKPEIFKTYSDGYIVRSMTDEDAEIVLKWYTGMGTVSRHELCVVRAAFPPGKGFYIGEYEGNVVSSAIRIPWGPDIYYGSFYYVEKAYRGRGFGTRLRDEVAFGHVGNSKLCVDAVLGNVAKANEEKFGYKRAFMTRRYEGIARDDLNLTQSLTIAQVSSISFDKIIEYDDKHFVSPGSAVRHEFLRRWCAVEGGAAYAAIDNTGAINGLGVRIPCIQDKTHIIGPLYADDSVTAEAIMAKLMSDVIGERISISIWMPNEEATAMVQKCGLEMIFEVCRMHANGDPEEFKSTVYGLTSICMCGF